MRTFMVDDVEENLEPPVTRSLAKAFEGVMCLGADPAASVIDTRGAHPLIGAVHAAFAEHRPLCLSPDAVWLTIAQGVAQHVRSNAEGLRGRLVRHEGREPIEVRHQGPMPRDDRAAWESIVHGFRDGIAARMGNGIARLFTCAFTTSTLADRVASEIVLMDAVLPYFDFYVACVCGIPTITLLGTPADWRLIRERVDVVAELGLEMWARSLAPIADHFVSASEGRVDLAHWKRIYKPREAYGTETVTGWIARLYPYVKRLGRLSEPNPLLGLPLDEPRDRASSDRWYNGPGIKLEDVPGGLSSVPVRVVDFFAGTRTEVSFEGGLLGVAVDDRTLSPIGGYVIRERAKSLLDILDEIERAHRTAPARRDERELGTADIRLLYDRMASVTLFPGEREWRIRPTQEWQHVELSLPHGKTQVVSRFIDLPNEQCIAFCADWESGGTLYVLCDARRIAPPRRPRKSDVDWATARSTQPIEDIPVVATTLAALLAHAIETRGDERLPPIGRLVDRLPRWMMEPRPPPRRGSERS